MSVQMNSFSSSLILATTLFRNQPGIGNKVIAQGGYALAALVSTVESVVALSFTALSLIAYPFSSTPFNQSATWLSSSVFSFGWSITDFIMNPFVFNLVADEFSARKILESGNLTIIPSGALLSI